MYSLPQLLLLPLAFHLVHVRAACPAPLAAVDENPAIVEGDPKCPGDQGKAVVADDGTHVLLQCCLEQSFSAKSVGKVKGVNSRMECVNKCFSDEHEHCDSVKYSAKNRECELFQFGGLAPQPAKCGDLYDWLFFIDPPPQVPMDVTHLCSTECLAAHNQKYVSGYGKVFHMECGKRHGTAPFKEEKTASYRDCLDGCAKNPKCIRAAPKKASGYNSAYSFGCDGACDKDEDKCGCSGKDKSSDKKDEL